MTGGIALLAGGIILAALAAVFSNVFMGLGAGFLIIMSLAKLIE